MELFLALLYVVGVITGSVGVLGFTFCLVVYGASFFSESIGTELLKRCFKITGWCLLVSVVMFFVPVVYEALFL